MIENLRVNANTSTLEFKRKHNLLVEGLQSGEFAIDFSNLVDSQGHKRFIEGNIDLNEDITNITKKYGKWSLSGTHLLIVLAFSIAENVSLAAGYIADVNLPQWVLDKIYPLFGNNIDFKTFDAFASGGDNSQSISVYLDKSTNKLQLFQTSLSANTNRSCRIAFDLLIDNEEPETQEQEEQEEQGE